MSSWSNKGIPRRRDISQIPEFLRPTIIPRAARQEIVISESFQEVTSNEIVLGSRKNEPAKKIEEPVINKRQFVTKKIDTSLNSSAYELRFRDKSYVFVILRHIRTTRDNDLWISSYNSIRKFYTNKIVIIDDNSTINTVDGKLNNTEIINGGTRRYIPNILMMPFKVLHNLIKYGKILPSIFWDFFGFAEFILIKKK